MLSSISFLAFIAPISQQLDQTMSRNFDLMLLFLASGLLVLLLGMVLFALGRILSNNTKKHHKHRRKKSAA